MNVGDTCTDVYASVVERLYAGEERSLLRKMVKQVIVEMLGSGNFNRTGPASTKPPKNPLKFISMEMPMFLNFLYGSHPLHKCLWG
jgi:hypothetical protein